MIDPGSHPETSPLLGRLWHIQSYGRELHPAGKRYFWDNGVRDPRNGFVVQLTLASSIRFESPRLQRDIGPGSVMLFNYGEPVTYGLPQPLTQDYRCLWASFAGPGMAEHLGTLVERHGPVLDPGLDHPLFVHFDRLLTDIEPARALPPTQVAGLLHRFVMALFDYAEQHKRQALSPVEQAVEAILEQPYAPESLKQWAVRYGVSREHLSRRFAERVGQPPHAFIAEARRGRAIALLTQTRLPLDQVAQQAGYANTHTLTRHIREATGKSPTSLRGVE